MARADVCLILEGTYPFVAGGVSSWTHDLIRAQPDLEFHLLTLLAPGADLTHRYELPRNVVGTTRVTIQDLAPGRRRVRGEGALFEALEAPLARMLASGDLDAFAELLALVRPRRDVLGQELLLDSKPAWNMLLEMYGNAYPDSSFLDYFWSWRALLGGLYSVLLGPLPAARVYHTVSTGYAGLYAARAALETARPVLLTEHGIYTNERRIEIAMADWLYELPLVGLGIDKSAPDLKDFWIAAFEGYSRACYQACERIITLYEGNQQFQIADGAPLEKLHIIPNGIDVQRYSRIQHSARPRPPRVALIGRVVPIKDVKTFIRAMAQLRVHVADAQAVIMGPTEEDAEYFGDCERLVAHLGLENVLKFAGRVQLDEHLGEVDVVVLTSISEAQPLVILEAGAAGIPSVATDVGSCREIIMGRPDEQPPLGAGGGVTMLSDPEATALAVARLLTDPRWYATCSAAISARVTRYYDEADVNRTYGKLYREALDRPGHGAAMGEAV